MQAGDLKPGLELGPSSWIGVDQERISAFALATDDEQWIHVDPDRAADGPFGGTIAHGLLSLSLTAPFSAELLPVECRMTINYGLERVRFPAPLPSGSRIRATYLVVDCLAIDGGVQALIRATMERETGDKPVCVAELIYRFYD